MSEQNSRNLFKDITDGVVTAGSVPIADLWDMWGQLDAHEKEFYDASVAAETSTRLIAATPVSSISAFGESVGVTATPIIQSAPIYGFLPANFRGETITSGTAGVVGREFSVSTGTTANASGRVKSFRQLKYRPGQGGEAKFTARFQTGGIADSEQGVGLSSPGDEISFGYNGVNFGIWHRHGGLIECQALTVSGAASGGESATVFVDGVSLTIPLTSGTVQHNAFEIAAYMTANLTGWLATQNDDVVTVVSATAGDKTGTFSFSSATATGAWVETTAGLAPTSDFTAQASWNTDVMPGLDTSKGNVYKIVYQYLGYGNLFFYIEDQNTGRFKLVHVIKWANANTSPSFGNPTMPLSLYAISTGSTTDITVSSASVQGATQGPIARTRNPRSKGNVKSIGTTLTNIITIRNKTSVNGFDNKVDILPYTVSAFTDSVKGATIQLITNATLAGETNFQEVGSSNLSSEFDITGTTVTGGRILAEYRIAGNSTLSEVLRALAVTLPPTITLTLAGAVTSGSASDIGGSIIWYEDV